MVMDPLERNAAAGNLATSMVDQALEGNIGPETGFVEDAMQAIPTIPASVGNMGRRGGNTIIGGGWADRGRVGSRVGRGFAGGKPIAEAGYIRQAARQNNPFNPFNWGRYGSDQFFHGSGSLGKNYSPHYASQFANWIDRKVRGVPENPAAKAAAGGARGAAGPLDNNTDDLLLVASTADLLLALKLE